MARQKATIGVWKYRGRRRRLSPFIEREECGEQTLHQPHDGFVWQEARLLATNCSHEVARGRHRRGVEITVGSVAGEPTPDAAELRPHQDHGRFDFAADIPLLHLAGANKDSSGGPQLEGLEVDLMAPSTIEDDEHQPEVGALRGSEVIAPHATDEVPVANHLDRNVGMKGAVEGDLANVQDSKGPLDSFAGRIVYPLGSHERRAPPSQRRQCRPTCASDWDRSGRFLRPSSRDPTLQAN